MTGTRHNKAARGAGGASGARTGAAGGIYVGLGANLPSGRGPPRVTLEAALGSLCGGAVTLCRLSPWYRSAPVPDLGQPWFVNAVAEVATVLPPPALLARLLEIETAFGRVRGERWQARGIDLDLIDYRGRVSVSGAPLLPHPRMAARAFVLRPLADIAPRWRHPVSGRGVRELLAGAAARQRILRA